MQNLSFEDAVHEYHKAARDTDVNAPEPDAEHSERLSDGWFLRDERGEPITTVRDDGAVWTAYTRVIPPKAANNRFGPLEARPDIAEIAIEVLIGEHGYHIEFREEAFDKLEQLGWYSTIASHLKAVIQAYGEDAKARDDAAKHEAYARHTRELLTRAKTAAPPLYDDGIPF